MILFYKDSDMRNGDTVEFIRDNAHSRDPGDSR